MLNTEIKNNVQIALAEDLGSGDITAALLPNHPARAQILCREKAILCGKAWADEVFHQLSPQIHVQWFFQDGDEIPANTIVCEITGPAQSLLTGERTVLNFLQTLSATATITRRWVHLIAHTPCQLLDSRKTLPGLRLAQKYAVRVGGGTNHRLGLYDAYLIKENHIAAAGGITPALNQARALNPKIFLEIEVENLVQLEEAIQGRPDRIMLDNFSFENIQKALSFPLSGIPLEVSGGMDETSLVTLAELGIPFVSAGSLTKNIKAIDFSFRMVIG